MQSTQCMAASMSCASLHTRRLHAALSLCVSPATARSAHANSDRKYAVSSRPGPGSGPYLHLGSDLLALLLQLTRRTALSHLQHEQWQSLLFNIRAADVHARQHSNSNDAASAQQGSHTHQLPHAYDIVPCGHML